MLVVPALGYDAVLGQIINENSLAHYTEALEKYGIAPVFRVLVPERSVCLERDRNRACWTAGAEWVDKWYGEYRAFLVSHPALCVDNSAESAEETFHRHFKKLV